MASDTANKGAANRRVPNAFMIFVKEKSQEILKNCSDEDKASMGVYLGRKWRSMSVEEKEVYFEKYKALKALENEELDPDPNRVDTSPDDVNMKLKSGLAPSSANQKPLKKVRRPPNAFILFAKEHRNSVDHSLKKDTKNHTSTILGNMWRDLTDSQKEKYVTEARRLLDLHKIAETASSRTVRKRKTKAQFEIALEKPPGRRLKKKKEVPSSVTTNLQNQEVNGDGKTEIEPNSNKSSENVENAGNITTSSEPHAFSNHRNQSHLHQYNGAGDHLHHMPSSVEPRHSNPCCPCFNNDASWSQNSNSGFQGMPRSWFGAASFSPLCSPYPFNVPPWMYQQHQSMAYQWFPYPSPSFYPSPYSYPLPYSYNNSYNGYVNYYQAQYSKRVVESSSYAAANPNTPAAASANVGEESAEAEKTDDNSNDELVVDEGEPNEEEHQEDGTE